MLTRKIAAIVAAGCAVFGSSNVSADSGLLGYDECVIACLLAGGGQQGDGTFCKWNCIRKIDNPPTGGGSGSGGTGLPPGPRTPGCNTAGSRLCADKQ